jgi:hypothetical protein
MVETRALGCADSCPISGRNLEFRAFAATVGSVASDQWDELVEHLTRTTPLSPDAAARIVEDVVAYFSEPAEDFIRRRHRELQAARQANSESFRRIAAELAGRPVAAPQFSERQIRRVIYG